MKVLADTPAGCAAEDRPRLVAGLLLATLACLTTVVLLFALRGERAEAARIAAGGLAGLAAMAAFLRRRRVEVTREAVTLVTVSPYRRTRRSWALADVAGAETATSPGARGGTLYRPVLRLQTGETVALADPRPDRPAVAAVVSALDAALTRLSALPKDAP